MFRKMSNHPVLCLLSLVVLISVACERPVFLISNATAVPKTFTYQGKGIHTWAYNNGEQTCPTEDDMTLTIDAGKVTFRSEGKGMYIQGIQNYTCYELHPEDRYGITLAGRYDMATDSITFTLCATTSEQPRAATGTAKMVNGLMTGEVTCENGEAFKFALPEVK